MLRLHKRLRTRKGRESMNAERYRRGLLIPTLVSGLLLPVALAAEAPVSAAGNQKAAVGAIVGVIRNAAKAPVGGVTVTSANADGTGLRATVSGSDGIYSFADVTPGEYSLSSQAEGYPDMVVSKIQVAAGQATRNDIVIASAPQPTVISSNSPAPKASTPPPANTAESAWTRRLKELGESARCSRR